MALIHDNGQIVRVLSMSSEPGALHRPANGTATEFDDADGLDGLLDAPELDEWNGEPLMLWDPSELSGLQEQGTFEDWLSAAGAGNAAPARAHQTSEALPQQAAHPSDAMKLPKPEPIQSDARDDRPFERVSISECPV